MSLGQVGGVGCYLVCHHSCAHIVLVGQRKMLLWCDVAEHGCAVPAYHGCADGTGYVVVTGSNVGDKRAKSIERCAVALVYLPLHVCLNLVHRHVARAFDERLHILLPRSLNKFAHSVKFGKLGCVVGIVGAAGTETVAK